MEYVKKLRLDVINPFVKVLLYDLSRCNTSLESRILAANFAAGTVFGKLTSNDPKKRYLRLMVLCNNETPSRPLLFVPYIFDVKKHIQNPMHPLLFNNLMRFGFMDKDGMLLTNLRSIGKFYKQNSISKTSFHECPGFYAYKLYIPIFVRDQLKTHTMLSSICESHRVGKNNNFEYYYPEDITERLNELNIHHKYENIDFSDFKQVHEFFSSMKNELAISTLKSLGYPKEIYSRYPNGLLMTHMTLCGWMQDEYTFQNLFLLRSDNDVHKHWTQKLTRLVVNVMKKQMEEWYNV